MLHIYFLIKLTVGLTWDKAIDKNARSIDKKDIGKIKHISENFIQIEKGLVNKDNIFIPKYYVQGYEDDNIIISLTENEIKNKFMNQSNPSNTILNDNSYKERINSLNKKYPDFESTIPQYHHSESEGIQISWDKVIDKKVKSSDNEEIGKIKSIHQYFVEIEDGTISKKHYFVPKKFLLKYDGNTIYSSLTKDEILEKYQRDSPPLETELEEIERGKDYELIPFMAKEPGLEIKTPSMNETLKIQWDEIIHKHVRTADNIDLGYIDKVGNEFVVVREGVVNVHLYYIPKKYIIKYDGSSLWLNISLTQTSSKFERKTEPSQEEIQSLLNQ